MQKFNTLRELFVQFPFIVKLVRAVREIFNNAGFDEAISMENLPDWPVLLDEEKVVAGYSILLVQRWSNQHGIGFTVVFTPQGLLCNEQFMESEAKVRELSQLCYLNFPKIFLGETIVVTRVIVTVQGGAQSSSVFTASYQTENLLAFINGECPLDELKVDYYLN